MNELLAQINRIYHEGSYSYLLFKYVDREYWTYKFNQCFPDNYLDNLTDFNYNKCFTIGINISDVKANLGTDEFGKYINEKGDLYRLEAQISVLAPFAMVIYLRYYLDNGEVKLESSSKPFLSCHQAFEKSIKEFFINSDIIFLDDRQLKCEVPNVTLELREGKVSVYNCLFEDGFSYYPY